MYARFLRLSILLVVFSALAACGGKKSTSSPASTTLSGVAGTPYSIAQTVGKIATDLGDRNGARAVLLGLDRGYTAGQLVAAGVESRLAADGRPRSSTGGTEAPLGRRVGRFTARPARGAVSLVSLPIDGAPQMVAAPLLADALDEVLDKATALDLDYRGSGQAFASATDPTTVSEKQLTLLIISLAASGYSAEQITDGILLGSRVSFVFPGPGGAAVEAYLFDPASKMLTCPVGESKCDARAWTETIDKSPIIKASAKPVQQQPTGQQSASSVPVPSSPTSVNCPGVPPPFQLGTGPQTGIVLAQPNGVHVAQCDYLWPNHFPVTNYTLYVSWADTVAGARVICPLTISLKPDFPDEEKAGQKSVSKAAYIAVSAQRTPAQAPLTYARPLLDAAENYAVPCP